MIRLTRIGKFNVSNRVAVLAAIALFLTSFAGLNNDSANATVASQSVEISQQSADGFDTKPERKLSISLLLFGQG